MPAKIGTGRWNLAANSKASNCVLSPISLRKTTPVETKKVSTEIPGSGIQAMTTAFPPRVESCGIR